MINDLTGRTVIGFLSDHASIEAEAGR